MPSVVFDRAADYYDETRGFPPGVEDQIAILIRDLAHLTTFSRVLELGIGTGRIALPLSKHVRAVYGVDLSRLMLNRLLAKQSSEPIHVVEGDITRLPFKPSSFDAAVAVHVFHLVPNWQDSLRELARVLRPGAPLIQCRGGGESGLDQLWQAWNAQLPAERVASVGVPHDKIDTFPLDLGWRAAGEERIYEYSYYLTPRTILERAERRTWSRMWRLTDEEFARCLEAMRGAFETQFSDPDQPVLVKTRFHARLFLPPSDAP